MNLIDHIFIFSTQGGLEADQLVNLGFVEGSSRTHHGQGTTNRKFYFDHFFLEILWVINEEEIQQDIIQKSGLTNRARHLETGHSPIGLCLHNVPITDELFKKAQCYQPDYFPPGMHIDVLANEQSTSLPWTFRLPYRNERKLNPKEPKQNQLGISELTQITLAVSRKDHTTSFTEKIQAIAPQIRISIQEKNQITLTFDHGRQGKTCMLPTLGLFIEY